MRYFLVFFCILFLFFAQGCSFDVVKKGMEGAGVDEKEVVDIFIFLFKTLKELKAQKNEQAFIKMLNETQTVAELSLLLKNERIREIVFRNEELTAFIEEDPQVYVCLVKGYLPNDSNLK